MGEYRAFSARQAEYIKNSYRCWLNVCEGGKRAGKNVCNVIGFAMCVEDHADKLHLAGGVSIAAARMNILDCNGFGLLNYFGGRCRIGLYNGKQALFVRTEKGEKIIIFAGGGRANDAALIKGNSFGSVYVSEINECHESFFCEVMDRTLASSDRKLFFDLNPKPPSHWFYRNFLDRQDKMKEAGENDGYQYAHFTIADNLSVSRKQLDEVLATYDKGTLWFAADILGKRVSATGRIYEGYDRKKVAVGQNDINKMSFTAFSVGVDVGGTDATVATLTGFGKGFREVWHLDGYYHRQGKSGGYTHDRYAKEISLKILEWSERFPQLLFDGVVFCEAADKLFRQALQNELLKIGVNIRVVPSYKKDGVLDRIRLVSLLINQGRYKVAGHLGKWHEALENAVWCEKARSEGRWVRVDDGSYPVDTLDSAEYSVQPFKGKLLGYKI